MSKLFTIAVSIMGFLVVAMLTSGRLAPEDIGQMPTVVVTASRYDVETESLGLIDTVVVSAPRHMHTDAAWSGLLDTVVVLDAPGQLSGSTGTKMTYRNPLGSMIADYYRRVE